MTFIHFKLALALLAIISAMAEADCIFQIATQTVQTPTPAQTLVTVGKMCPSGKKALAVTCEGPGAASMSDAINLKQKRLGGANGDAAWCTFGVPGMDIPSGLTLKAKVLCVNSACVVQSV